MFSGSGRSSSSISDRSLNEEIFCSVEFGGILGIISAIPSKLGNNLLLAISASSPNLEHLDFRLGLFAGASNVT